MMPFYFMNSNSDGALGALTETDKKKREAEVDRWRGGGGSEEG